MIRITISLICLVFAGCSTVVPGSKSLTPTRSHLDEKTVIEMAEWCEEFLDGRIAVVEGTGSMGSEFFAGQYVVLDDYWEGIRAEDSIIGFRYKGEQYIHRAIAYDKRTNQWLTDSDAGRMRVWVSERDYAGTVVVKFYHQPGKKDNK